MRKSKIIKTAKYYVDFFDKNKQPTDYQKSEYRDFVKLHLERNSDLVYSVDYAGNDKIFNHSKSVLAFLKNNDSKINYTKSNFISSLDNQTLVAILIFVIPSLVSLGYYFGHRDSKQLDDINKKLDSIISTPFLLAPQDKTNKKAKVDYHNNSNDTLKKPNLDHYN